MTASTPTAAPRTLASSLNPDDAAAVTAIIRSFVASWARGDADMLSQLYADDATVVLPGDVYLKGRAAIREGMSTALAGRWAGTHVLGLPLELRYVADGACLLVSQGGAYPPGADQVSVDDAIRGMWVFTRQGSDWSIAAYENTPLRAAIPIPDAARATPDGNR